MSRSLILRASSAIVAVLVLAAAGVGATKHYGDDGGSSTITGIFTDAGPLNIGSHVRAMGVNVGSVKDIALENGKARITMSVDSAVLPLRRDARLTIKPVNLLGERYIELDPGSPSKPYRDDSVVPVKHTKSAVTVQDLFDTFDDPTATALAAVVTTLGEGLDGSGEKVATAIKALAPALHRAKDLGGVLKAQNETLNQLVDRIQPVATALAANEGKTLDRLVGSTERTLSTLAANQQVLDATMAELPATLTEARRTLRELAGVSDAATPTLRAIRPVTENVTEITGELQRFADAADPALATLRPVLRRADELLKQAAPVVDQLRKAGPDLRVTASRIRPLGDVLLDENLEDLMAFVKKWALSTNARDGLTNYARGVVFVTPKTLQDLASTVLSPRAKRNNLRSLGDSNKNLVPQELGPDVSPEESAGTDLGNVTGLTPKQEQSMLSQFIGGS